ncbi:mediator of RNA polymerase II transcription subunit 15 isoform X3 [Drosophila grimshawi]|uniref:mediator of RNA polymerase II transcription subunit 15 isoform X3 n=1 Tax=Drosophila grimshawi TaxID=7222 RepID=UPI001C9321C4|nr:mediator of RNA polymerase II transcription subunit 15 isoform X3 [Drosophila grimshawi]
MNNFTTTTAAVPKKESLPRSGHVNEVCKEWLVREDGALAYKLQSQEINDFYKGNRYRNAVVREDFPTALHEQIKETEQAQRQVEAYRRRLTEQEEHDKRVAKEIADKLERDLQEQQQEELQQSELIAQKMQEIYVNLPPVPPPTTRDKSRPPPRPAKASIRQQQLQLQQQQQQQSNGSLEPSTSQQARYHSQQQQQQQQQQHFSQTDNYVGLSLIPNIVDKPATAAVAATAAAATSTPSSRHNAQNTHNQLLKLSPEKYDQMVGNFALGNSKAAERHMQQHADDIELYVDPCDYASLRDIGVPPEEIHEMSKKIKQEQKDELLARRLQAIESKDSVRQEQRDRLLAIEAQDKELAKMLQERYGKNIFKLRKFKISAVKEKAKVKRAKEKARLRKSQQKDVIGANGVGVNGLLCGTNGSSHCGPLMALPQDCMSSSQTPADIDVEAYSNPIDVLNNSREQRQPNGTLTNGSLTRDSSSSTHGSMQRQQRQAAAAASSLTRGEDDIYTLPVDSCRLAGNGQRPISLHLAAETVQQLQQQQQQQHNSMTRSENYGSEAGSHDSTLSSGHDVSPHMKYSKSGNFGIYIQAPVPRRLICQFRVRADQIQVKIVKRNRRTTSARISETAFR